MVNKNDSTDRDVTDKKRRKTSITDSSITKLSKEDIYTNTINFEEKESVKRSPDKDATLFHNTCDEIRKIFDEISNLKKEASEETKLKIAEKRIEGSLSFVILKKLNRLDKVRIRAGREALHKEKLRVDSNRLQLQNLLYEADHLKKEVQRCYQFKSQDEEIELVPVAEFYEKAPPKISRPEKTRIDEHARRIARLEWELQQRKELDALCKELHASKEKVAQEIVLKTERLDSLAPRLQDLLKATRPLQDALEMQIEKNWEVQKSVRLLCQPLYLLYANVTAYSEACDNLVSATIEGDDEEAKQMEDSRNDENSQSSSTDNNHDSDNEDNDMDLEAGNKKRHHRRQTKSNILEQKRENLLKVHPLSVTFTINTKENKGSLALVFQYIPVMGFVTTKCKLIDFTTTGVAAGDVMSTENILNGLFKDDFGLESPNSKTKYQLQDASLEPSSLIQLLADKDLGKPFKWAQELCGLEFIATPSGKTSSDLCQNSIPNVIKLLRNRWESRLKLYKQIHELESGSVDTTVSSEQSNPVRISSNLLQWSTISHAEYVSSNVAQKFIDNNVATNNDLYYRAIITRGSAKLECYVCVSCNFPSNSPLWALSLNWNGKHTAEINSSLREMEYWINSIDGIKQSKTILLLQLKRAMSCLDIYLETEGPYYSPAEFTQDKTFLRSFRGRQRSRPFKITPTGSSVVFTQI